MKTLKLMGMALLAACLNVGLIACSDENKDAPEPEDAFINESGSNNYFTNGMNFTSVASELTFAFDTNMDWSISVANTVNGTPWCYASTTSGGAGHYEVVVKVDENTSYDDRNVTLTIQAGMAKKTIIVTQKQKDAILLTSNKFEVDKAGGKINVEVKSNINYTVEIAETDKNWIKKSSTDTRALSTNTLTFEISPSEEYDKREGEIYVKSGEMIETVHVYQTGGGTILLTKNEYPVSDKGETIAVELKSNCEFEVKMPNVDWIKDAPATKAMSSHTLYYVISPNETYDSREAKIIYYDKNNMNVADTLVVIQVQKDALILSQKEYEVGASGGDLEIKLSTNIQYALSISQEDATWIQQVTTRSLVDETLYFKIAENKSLDTRIGSIVIEADKDKKETIKIIQAGKREDVVVLNVAKAGTLNQLVSYSQKNQIINLKLTGLLNGDDIRFIREMAGRDSNGNKTEGQLQILDLSEASIVAGGDYYYYKSSKKYYINDNTLTNYVFYQCENLSSIEIPKTVIKIGDYAFYDCKSLTSIDIPNDVAEIGDYAFSNCTNLVSIGMPNSVIKIGSSTFSYCKSLTSIDIPNSVTEIESATFLGCTSLASINLPESITMIGSRAFEGCSNLTSIDIPNSVTEIESATFLGCTSLASINLPESITMIGSRAFEGGSNLTSIDIPNSVTEIENDAFAYCTSLTSVNIPNSVTKIEFAVFSGCTSLTSINIPNSITKIEYAVFSGCTSLTSINIPNSVTAIESLAFNNCTSLTSIDIPNSVTRLADQIFRGCTSLASVNLSNSITKIESAVFSGCTSLASINLPESITMIGSRAFEGCSNLTSIDIPNSVTEIENDAFAYCTSLTSIDIPESVTTIKEKVFYGCTNLVSATIPSKIATLITKVPYGLTSYKDVSAVFAECTTLKKVYVKSVNPPAIKYDTFSEYSYDYATLYVPEGCKEAYLEHSGWQKFKTIVEE